jgi:hypothetical protein
MARGHQERRRISRSTPLTEEIRRTTKVVGTTGNNPRIRRIRDPSDAPMMQRCGARSIIPMDMIWMSAKLFCIVKGCRHQQPRHLKILVGESITERFLMAMSIWRRST